MARKSRVVINRAAAHEVDRAFAEGLEGWAAAILDVVDVPDAAPFGEGLVEGGGWISYVDGKKVGESQPGVQKPRDMRVRGRGVAVGVGFGFPGRFQETGTMNYDGNPWFTPALMAVVGDRSIVEGSVREAFRRSALTKARRATR